MAEHYSISSERVVEVCRAGGERIHESKVREICTDDWSEGQEHQDWLDNAPAADIASWVAGIVKDNDRAEDNECIYCGARLADFSRQGSALGQYEVPDVDADGEWNLLAREHARNCEWIRTRAHRIMDADCR